MHKPFILFCSLFFSLLFLSAVTAEQEVKKPNILVILVDDLGYNDLGSYGSKDMQTPYIDSLVYGGVRFTHFYANSSVCSPTRAALLTGRYPEMVGVPGVIRTDPKNSWGYLLPKVETLPSLLKKNGYHTALIGKWHLGLEAPNRPTDKGFSHFQGFLGDMMDDYYTHLRHHINYMRLNNNEIRPQGHATDLFSDWASRYIESRQATKKPFFLYLAYNAPHDPIQPPTEWVNRVKERENGISEKRAKLVAFIEHMDAGIGKVVQTLKKTGAYQNTIIIFSSDNGGRLDLGANNGKVRSGKGSMYEGGLKVPACLVWPARINHPSTTSAVSLTIDIFPTLLEAAGIAYHPQDIDGVSLLPFINGQGSALTERPVFFCRREGDAEYGGKTIDAVRMGDWKLLQNFPFAQRELYNLKEDPLESNNLMATHKEKFRELEALLRAHIQKSGSVPWQKTK